MVDLAEMSQSSIQSMGHRMSLGTIPRNIVWDSMVPRYGEHGQKQESPYIGPLVAPEIWGLTLGQELLEIGLGTIVPYQKKEKKK